MIFLSSWQINKKLISIWICCWLQWYRRLDNSQMHGTCIDNGSFPVSTKRSQFIYFFITSPKKEAVIIHLFLDFQTDYKNRFLVSWTKIQTPSNSREGNYNSSIWWSLLHKQLSRPFRINACFLFTESIIINNTIMICDSAHKTDNLLYKLCMIQTPLLPPPPPKSNIAKSFTSAL